jgi:hypothetical protein
MNKKLDKALNRLVKWRMIFTGWQLGTRSITDPEAQAVRDHRELTMLLRVEASAVATLLIEKGVFTLEEYEACMISETMMLDKLYEQKFPGWRSDEDGMVAYDPALAAETMKYWRK